MGSDPRYYYVRVAIGPLPEGVAPSPEDILFDAIAAQAAKRVAPGVDAICDTWIAGGPPTTPVSGDGPYGRWSREELIAELNALVATVERLSDVEAERDRLRALIENAVAVLEEGT